MSMQQRVSDRTALVDSSMSVCPDCSQKMRIMRQLHLIKQPDQDRE
jgi:hypothetical protein